MKDDTILVIPCSGMGKIHGLIGREATYMAVENALARQVDTVCLALLVNRDTQTVEAVHAHKCITLDGCPKECARKNVEMAGGMVTKAIRIVDAFRNHRGVQPGTATTLTEDGWQIVSEIAENVMKDVEVISSGMENQ